MKVVLGGWRSAEIKRKRKPQREGRARENLRADDALPSEGLSGSVSRCGRQKKRRRHACRMPATTMKHTKRRKDIDNQPNNRAHTGARQAGHPEDAATLVDQLFAHMARHRRIVDADVGRLAHRHGFKLAGLRRVFNKRWRERMDVSERASGRIQGARVGG